jgi:hypothetical protein
MSIRSILSLRSSLSSDLGLDSFESCLLEFIFLCARFGVNHGAGAGTICSIWMYKTKTVTELLLCFKLAQLRLSYKKLF